MFKDTDQSEFKVGQVWTYKARPGEEASTLTVLKVQTAPKWSTVVHVGIRGVKVKTLNGVTDVLPHLPFSEEAVKKSVIAKVSDQGPLTDFHDGYEMWSKAATSGKGGIFTITVGETVATVEEGFTKVRGK